MANFRKIGLFGTRINFFNNLCSSSRDASKLALHFQKWVLSFRDSKANLLVLICGVVCGVCWCNVDRDSSVSKAPFRAGTGMSVFSFSAKKVALFCSFRLLRTVDVYSKRFPTWWLQLVLLIFTRTWGNDPI